MLTGLDHIQLAMPQGGEETARAFYMDVLGLSETAKPPQLAHRGGLWLSGAGISLHLGVEDPFQPARKAHPAFIVGSLEAMKAHLNGHGIAFKSDKDLPGITRIFVSDPFGNRIELLERRDRLS